MKQQLQFRIYPMFGEPGIWTLDAHVFGDWAVHKPHPDELSEYSWVISHAPTGVAGFECEKFTVAIQAAKRLAAMEQPVVEVEGVGTLKPYVKPLSIEWIKQSATLLSDMDIWCRAGGNLVHPGRIVEHIESVRQIPDYQDE